MNEVVYNEDLVKTVKNKYLAVNVVAKRARQLNTEGLPLVPSGAGNKRQKPVAIATQELVDGKLRYEQGEAKALVPEHAFRSQELDDGSELFGEQIILQEEHGSEEEEPEEGR